MYTPEKQIVLYSVAGEYFAASIQDVSEIIRYQKIQQIPGCPQYILGVTAIRDKTVRVVDFRRRFGFPERHPDSQTRIIIVSSGANEAGIMVDSVLAVESYTQEIFKKSEEQCGIQNRYTSGIITRSDKLICLIDFSQLLKELVMLE